MDDTKETLPKKVKYIVIGAVSFLFVLVTVLIFQIGFSLSNNAQIRNLEAENARLDRQIEAAIRDLELMVQDGILCEDFILEFALRELGWGRPGQVIFRR